MTERQPLVDAIERVDDGPERPALQLRESSRPPAHSDASKPPQPTGASQWAVTIPSGEPPQEGDNASRDGSSKSGGGGGKPRRKSLKRANSKLKISTAASSRTRRLLLLGCCALLVVLVVVVGLVFLLGSARAPSTHGQPGSTAPAAPPPAAGGVAVAAAGEADADDAHMPQLAAPMMELDHRGPRINVDGSRRHVRHHGEDAAEVPGGLR
jgi:hypothetical protein